MDAFSERIFTEDSEGNNGWNWVCNLFVIFASFCGFSCLPPYRIFTEDSEGNKDWIGFEPLRPLRFLLLISFTSCFAELAGRLNGICRVDQSKPRVSNLGFCKETFVIFASFCSNFFERLFTEGNEGNKRFDLFGSPSLSSFPSVYVFFLLAALLRIGLDD
jgi:hypothetical protein